MTGWTPEEIAFLRQWWLDGVTTNEIARRLNRSKNSIIGRAHRLGLPGRASPIKPRASGRQQRLRHNTLAVLTSTAPAFTASDREIVSERRREARVTEKQMASESAPAPAPMPARVSKETCCWPLSGEGRRTIWCSGLAIEGKPYCAEHQELAYVRVPAKDAA